MPKYPHTLTFDSSDFSYILPKEISVWAQLGERWKWLPSFESHVTGEDSDLNIQLLLLIISAKLMAVPKGNFFNYRISQAMFSYLNILRGFPEGKERWWRGKLLEFGKGLINGRHVYATDIIPNNPKIIIKFIWSNMNLQKFYFII